MATFNWNKLGFFELLVVFGGCLFVLAFAVLIQTGAAWLLWTYVLMPLFGFGKASFLQILVGMVLANFIACKFK